VQDLLGRRRHGLYHTAPSVQPDDRREDLSRALAAVPGDLRVRFARLEALSALNRRRRRGGQHFTRLKRYLDGYRFDRVKRLYFTTGRPEYDGIQARRRPPRAPRS